MSIKRSSLVVITLLVCSTAVEAQTGRARQPAQPGGGPPASKLMAALDADKDGKLSAKEIQNAVAVLKSLDADKNGKLTGDEIGWPPPNPFGRGRGFGGPPGGVGPGGGRPRRPGGASSSLAARILSYDKDKDGKVTKAELPTFLHRMLGRNDANKNGALDKKELDSLFGSRPEPESPPKDESKPTKKSKAETGDRP